jgi:hypothetical protein
MKARDKFMEDRKEELRDAAFIVLVMGMSLVISAIILSLTSGVTVYHAFIVLNMSWINNITAIVPCFLITDAQGASDVVDASALGVKAFIDAVLSFSRNNLLYLLHMSAMASLGIWLFARIDSFGSSTTCTPTTIYYLAGHYVLADQSTLRLFWIVAYSIMVIPIVNVAILFSLVCVLDIVVTRLVKYHPKGLGDEERSLLARRINYISLIIIAFLLIIGLIVSTEQTIMDNNVGPGQGADDHQVMLSFPLIFILTDLWTFGQTLAVVLAFPAMWIGFTEILKLILTLVP